MSQESNKLVRQGVVAGVSLLLGWMGAAAFSSSQEKQVSVSTCSCSEERLKAVVESVVRAERAQLISELKAEQASEPQSCSGAAALQKYLQELKVERSGLVADIKAALPTDTRGGDAELAFSKALERETAGDANAALRYCLNAVTTNPTEIRYYTKLAELGAKLESAAEQEQILNIMDMGMYRVHADKMPELAQKTAELRASINEVQAARVASMPQPEPPTELLEKNWQELCAAANKPAEVIHLCRNRMALLQQADAAGLEGDLTTTSTILSCYERFSQLEKLLNELSHMTGTDAVLPPEELAIRNAQLQTASSGFVVLCSMDRFGLPTEFSKPLNAKLMELSGRLMAAEKNLLHAKSVPVRNLMNAIHENADMSAMTDAVYREYLPLLTAEDAANAIQGADGQCTRAIKSLTARIGKLSLLLPYISDAQEIADYKGKIATLIQQLAEKNKERVRRYQVWATEKCKTTQDKISEETYMTEEDARTILSQGIKAIDVALLRPESADMYHSVLNKLLARVNGISAELQKEIATADKKELTDF